MFAACLAGCGSRDDAAIVALEKKLGEMSTRIAELEAMSAPETELVVRTLTLVDRTGKKRIVLDGQNSSISMSAYVDGSDIRAAGIDLQAHVGVSQLTLSALEKTRVVIEANLSQSQVVILDSAETERATLGHYPMIDTTRLMIADADENARLTVAYRSTAIAGLEALGDTSTIMTHRPGTDGTIVAIDSSQ
jgi:hypothetical protein